MPHSDHELLGRLATLIYRDTGAAKLRVAPDTDLSKELRIDGSDGVDFVRAFAQEFNVDMSTFQPQEYFGPEASFNPFAPLFPSWWRRRARLRPLLVRHLIDAARAGRWSD